MFPQTSTPRALSNNIPIRGLAWQLALLNQTPLPLQLVVETDKLFCNGENRSKVGDGILSYNQLPYTVWEDLLDYGSILIPNTNTPIDAGSFLSPAVNFYQDFCTFYSNLKRI